MAAKAQYFADQQSAKSPRAGKTESEIVYSHVTSENSENILTSSALPSSTAQDIGNDPVNVPGAHIGNGTTGSPGLDTGNMTTDLTEPRTDCSLQWLQEKVGFIWLKFLSSLKKPSSSILPWLLD